MLTKQENQMLNKLCAAGAICVPTCLFPEGGVIQRNLLAALYRKGYAVRHSIGRSVCYQPVN